VRVNRFVEAMKIRPGDRVLEIGFGHGIAADLVCRKLVEGSYLGVDRSAKMVAAAKARNRLHMRSGKARFVQGTLESLDLGQQRFDKVFAMRVRVFHDQPQQARRLAKRWLAPKGKLFVEYDEPGEVAP
jgi:ubiquinone/menaquinone biosynthesis C-methylase UbiE